MRTYKIIDNEGLSFGSGLNGCSRKDIIEYFYYLGKEQEGFETLKRDYTLNYIMDIWNIDIIKIKEVG